MNFERAKAVLRGAALLIPLLVSSTAIASTKVLLFGDIALPEATFAWSKLARSEVAVSALVDRGFCMDEECYDEYSTGALPAFERNKRSVYFIGDGSGKTRVLCGRTGGFFSLPRFEDACRIHVEPEKECAAWVEEDDCGCVVTRYRVYLVIDD